MNERKSVATGNYGATTPNGLYVTMDVRDLGRDNRGRAWRGRTDRDIVFISHDDESIMDNFINRRDRPLDFYRKEIIPTIRKALGLDADIKFSWAQKAGCSCPCSPGYIISGRSQYYRGGKDIFVTVSAEAPRAAS